MKSLLSTYLIRHIFHVLQVCPALLKLMTVLETHAVHDKMRMDMVFVLMCCNQNLEAFPLWSFRRHLTRYAMSLLRLYFLLRSKTLNKVLVSPPLRLAPQLLGSLHFIFRCVRLAVQTAYQFLLCLFVFCHIIKRLPYACL